MFLIWRNEIITVAQNKKEDSLLFLVLIIQARCVEIDSEGLQFEFEEWKLSVNHLDGSQLFYSAARK